MPPDPPDVPFSHLSATGEASMVDVSGKATTLRTATASAIVTVGADVLGRLGSLPKGDALAAARLAGVMAAKRTSELIPLCHGLSPEHVEVLIEAAPPAALRIVATARVVAKTGVEMEAMTAVSVAALTIYDMCKSVSKAIEIGPIRLEAKTGGKSGDFHR